MISPHGLLILLLVTTAVATSSRSANAEVGVTDQEITVATVSQKTGPIAGSGVSLQYGAVLYFNKLNKEGGVNGRKIKALFYDDVYDPAKTIELTKKAIEQDHVFALIAYNGTPTSKSVIPIVRQFAVPYLFPRTGDASLRAPTEKYIVNVRPSFAEEMDVLIEEVAIKRKLKRIAVLAQADGFGDSLRAGGHKALAIRNLGTFVSEAKVERNATDMAQAFAAIDAGHPDVVFLGAATGSAVPFIQLALEKGRDWKFATISNNMLVIEKLKGSKAHVLISQTTPDLADTALPIVTEFRQQWKSATDKPEVAEETIAFEGYIAGKSFGEGLKKAGKALTREGFLKAYEGQTFDLGGMKIVFSGESRAAKAPVYLSEFNGTTLTSVK